MKKILLAIILLLNIEYLLAHLSFQTKQIIIKKVNIAKNTLISKSKIKIIDINNLLKLKNTKKTQISSKGVISSKKVKKLLKILIKNKKELFFSKKYQLKTRKLNNMPYILKNTI